MPSATPIPPRTSLPSHDRRARLVDRLAFAAAGGGSIALVSALMAAFRYDDPQQWERVVIAAATGGLAAGWGWPRWLAGRPRVTEAPAERDVTGAPHGDSAGEVGRTVRAADAQYGGMRPKPRGVRAGR